jgi:hypothetical protein
MEIVDFKREKGKMKYTLVILIPHHIALVNMECGLNFKKFKLFLIRSLILSFHQKIEKDA